MAGLSLMNVSHVATQMSPMSRLKTIVASEGFEPPNAEQSDLQSDPFGRLGNSPFALPTTSQLLTEGAR